MTADGKKYGSLTRIQQEHSNGQKSEVSPAPGLSSPTEPHTSLCEKGRSNWSSEMFVMTSERKGSQVSALALVLVDVDLDRVSPQTWSYCAREGPR